MLPSTMRPINLMSKQTHIKLEGNPQNSLFFFAFVLQSWRVIPRNCENRAQGIRCTDLQSWRGIFDRFDRDRNGSIDANELRDALLSLGFAVSPVILELLVSKFDKTGGRKKAIEYDNFIECCLTVKGLTEKFKEKDKAYTGMGTFTYEDFMLTVLPFLIA